MKIVGENRILFAGTARWFTNEDFTAPTKTIEQMISCAKSKEYNQVFKDVMGIIPGAISSAEDTTLWLVAEMVCSKNKLALMLYSHPQHTPNSHALLHWGTPRREMSIISVGVNPAFTPGLFSTMAEKITVFLNTTGYTRLFFATERLY